MLELTISRSKARQVLARLRNVIGNLRAEETDGDAEEISFQITEIDEDAQETTELVLMEFVDDVRYSWR